MSKHVRVNVRTLVNSSAIRKETRDGREYLIVSSATLPDGVVMNKIRYPAEVIEASFKGLEGKPAPLGHPIVNGEFVSASDPRGLVRGFFGAWNENIRRENGRVLMDKVVDIEYASQLKSGQRVLNAIEKGEPIHTSTGLYGEVLPLKNSEDGAEWEIKSMVFDHDAVLLDEDGAATPSQGVGMLVNKAVDFSGATVEVINSNMEDDAKRELEWAAEYAIRAAEKLQKAPMIERLRRLILETVMGSEALETTNKEEDQSMDKAQLDALNAKLDLVNSTMGDMAKQIGEAVTQALSPVVTAMNANLEAEKAVQAAKKEALVNSVVAAGLLTKEVAEVATNDVLEALANNIKTPKQGLRLNSQAPSALETKVEFQLPKAE